MDLFGHLGKLLQDQESLSDFRHWFNAASDQLEASSDPNVATLADWIHSRLQEYDDSLIDRNQLLEALALDLEFFRRRPLSASPRETALGLQADIERFSRGELSANHLQSRVECALEAMSESHAGSPEAEVITSGLLELRQILTTDRFGASADDRFLLVSRMLRRAAA